MKIVKLILLIVVFISIKGHPQSISENTSYPTSTQVQCEYKFNGGGASISILGYLHQIVLRLIIIPPAFIYI